MEVVKITFTQQVFSYTRLTMPNCLLQFFCSEGSTETPEEGVNFGQTK